MTDPFDNGAVVSQEFEGKPSVGCKGVFDLGECPMQEKEEQRQV